MWLSKFGLVVMLASSPCFADTFTCEYNFKNGVGLSEVEASWLGAGFRLDHEKGVVARRWHNGWENPRRIQFLIKDPEFTTYNIRVIDKTSDGDVFLSTHRFKIYQSGRCSIQMFVFGAGLLKAEGTWKKEI